jgi:hypothetical protein
MSKISIRRLLRYSFWASAALLLILLIYSVWPWVARLPKKFGPLANYRVYETGKRIEGSDQPSFGGWREPLSRWELLITRDVEVVFDHKDIERLHRLSKISPRPPYQKPIEPLNIRNDDKLRDFVIEFGDSFGYPDSQAQLDEAITRGEAQRSSDFFALGLTRQKPFYGRVPLSLAFPETNPEQMNMRVNELEIRRNGELIRTQLETPNQPAIIVIAASGITNAQLAVYNQTPPVSYDSDQYWAVIYAGSTDTDPRRFVLDRITIGQFSTEILLSASKQFVRDGGRYPSWFLVPLGHLPNGPYSVIARVADSDDLIADTTANLHRATPTETRAHTEEGNALQVAGSRIYEQRLKLERSHGAALQLRLQRLANFIRTLEPANSTTIEDLTELGKSVDWYQNIYAAPRQDRYVLAPPAPAEVPLKKTPDFGEQLPNWTSADIPLNSIWMCDGSDARWYASKTYREVPELNGALSCETPSPTQTKIRAIWKVLAEKSNESRAVLNTVPANGTMNEAIDAGYEFFVSGKEPVRTFSQDDYMWAVFAAKQSYLIRGIRTRTYKDKFSNATRKEFLIDTSAYIAEADGAAESERAPATLALIPLGKFKEDSVGVMCSCMSICARGSGSDQSNLIDATPPDRLSNEYNQNLGQFFGFTISH